MIAPLPSPPNCISIIIALAVSLAVAITLFSILSFFLIRRLIHSPRIAGTHSDHERQLSVITASPLHQNSNSPITDSSTPEVHGFWLAAGSSSPQSPPANLNPVGTFAATPSFSPTSVAFMPLQTIPAALSTPSTPSLARSITPVDDPPAYADG